MASSDRDKRSFVDSVIAKGAAYGLSLLARVPQYGIVRCSGVLQANERGVIGERIT